METIVPAADSSILNRTDYKLVGDEDPKSPDLDPEIDDSRVLNRNVFYEGTDEDHDNIKDEEGGVEDEEDVF